MKAGKHLDPSMRLFLIGLVSLLSFAAVPATADVVECASDPVLGVAGGCVYDLSYGSGDCSSGGWQAGYSGASAGVAGSGVGVAGWSFCDGSWGYATEGFNAVASVGSTGVVASGYSYSGPGYSGDVYSATVYDPTLGYYSVGASQYSFQPCVMTVWLYPAPTGGFGYYTQPCGTVLPSVPDAPWGEVTP